MSTAELPKADSQYHLVADKRALVKRGGELTFHEGRFNDLPDRPKNFKPIRGTYAQVSEAANRLNAVQENSGFLDYVYSPDPSGPMPVGYDSLHDKGIRE